MINKLALVGFDVENKSAYKYFKDKANEIVIHDQNPDLVGPLGVKTVLGPGYLEGLEEYDLVVRTPGVHPNKISRNAKVTSVTKEFFAQCQGTIIGVTGTKGKGTTSTLIAHMLRKSGKTVFLGGNIGVPALDFLGEVHAGDYVVLELSSFQLMDLTQSPHIAVALMMEADHLDWHADMQEYFESKQAIARYQTSEDFVVYLPTNEATSELAHSSAGQKQPYQSQEFGHADDTGVYFGETKILDTDQVKLSGKHNLDNVSAAVTAVWNITQDIEAIGDAIRQFGGLPHRLELVGEVDGVKYYDDSISTVPSTAIAAINAFTQPRSIILGGSDKGLDYTQLAEAIVGADIAGVVVMGATAQKIKTALDHVGFDRYTLAQNLQEAVDIATRYVNDGGLVLLSPACASFDQFKNYADRGDSFKSIVLNMI